MQTSNPGAVWLRPEFSGAGPKPQYSRREIARVAVRLADGGGLASVSMRKVAAQLGAGPASLYRYLNSHDELLEVMIDLAAEEYEFSSPSGEVPLVVAELTALAVQGRSIMHRHPWLPPLLLTRPATGPGTLAYLDHALWIMSPLDLAGTDKLQAVAMLTAITSAFVQNELAQAALIGDPAPGTSFLLTSLQNGGYVHIGQALAHARPAGNAAAEFAAVIRKHLIGAGVPSATNPD